MRIGRRMKVGARSVILERFRPNCRETNEDKTDQRTWDALPAWVRGHERKRAPSTRRS